MGNSTLFNREKTKTAVDKIINCTQMPMYVYGTSGTLLELTPRIFDLSKVKMQNKGVFYVVDEATEEALIGIDRKFSRKIVHPDFLGNGHNNEKIYRFILGTETLVPITEKYGRNGDVIHN